MVKKLSFLICLLVPMCIWAQSSFSGELKRNTRWFGEVFIEGDILIPKGVTLSIEPATRIMVRANKDRLNLGKDPAKIEIIVSGTLLANGVDKGGEILFTSTNLSPGKSDWHGIIIKNRKNPSTLRSCIIEYAYKGITCYGSSPRIFNCEIRFNFYSGISCEVRSKAIIRNCVLERNEFAGIVCELAATPLIESCIIRNNKNGIIIFDRSQPDLGRYPLIAGASAGKNEITGNNERDIYNQSSQPIYAQNNLWAATETQVTLQKIFDGADETGYGLVSIEPIFQNQNPLIEDDLSQVRNSNVASAQNRQADDGAPFLADDSPEAGVGASGSFSQGEIVLASNIKTPENIETQKTVERNKLPGNNTDFPAVDGSEFRPETEQKPTLKKENLEKLTERQTTNENLTNFQPINDKPVEEFRLDSKQRAYLHRVQPKYPPAYQKMRIEGKVQIRVVVDQTGIPEFYEVVRSSHRYFAEAAVEALRTTKYQPGTVQGKPVKFVIYETYRFRYN